MSNREERWPQVGAAIQERIDELQLTKSEVQRAGQISDKTLTRYLGGQPIVRRDKRRGLCAALEWPPDAIDRILDGLPPVDAGTRLTEAEGEGIGGDEVTGIAAKAGRLTPEQRTRLIGYIDALLDEDQDE